MSSWHVVGTAGHVDHGKSTLVLALTGTDPDRWREEKERGLTIDLGFASTVLPSGRGVAFVDVPGHVRFLRNMLAGIGAIDACLFVVAATEGWKPQSEEHLRIVELLGIRRGVIALTKVGLTDERPSLPVGGTFLAGAPVIEVDAPTGAGVEALRDALDALLADTPVAADRDRPRLWVDRAFAAKGAGTVVTGTLTGGSLRVGDDVEVAGARVRVRALQSHGSSLDVAPPGRRVAVNLAGIEHTRVERGDAVVRPGQWHGATVVDASLHVLAALDHDVTRRGAYVAYLGSGEHPVALRVLGPDVISPGGDGVVRLRLRTPLPLAPGDRYVLRESGRGETVGGGELLDVAPGISTREWLLADDASRYAGRDVAATFGRWVVSDAAIDAMRADLRARIGGGELDVAVLDERERAVLATIDDVVVVSGRARLATAEDPLRDDPWLRALDESPFAPPPPADPAVAREAARRNLVVERDGIWFSAGAVHQAAVAVATLLRTKPDGVTVAEIRDALGTTRKYLLPLLGILDGTGVTRRRDDVRIGGPRLPR